MVRTLTIFTIVALLSITQITVLIAAEQKTAVNPANDVRFQRPFIIGIVAFNKKDYAKAITTCQKLEAADPTTATGPRILARCHIAKKDWARAIRELELLQKRRPLDSFSYTQLAKIYVQLGQPEKALPELIYLHKHTMNDPKYARHFDITL